MQTFVLVIFFWEAARGYAITNVPGYESMETCRHAASELQFSGTPLLYNSKAYAICLPGPTLPRKEGMKPSTPDNARSG